MPTPTPIYPQVFNQTVQTITDADTTTLKTVFTPGVSGSKLEHILVSSTDTSSRLVQLYLTVSSTDYLLGTVTVSANAGNTASIATVNLFNLLGNFGQILDRDPAGNAFLYIAPNNSVKVATTTTVTTAKVVTFIATGEDF